MRATGGDHAAWKVTVDSFPLPVHGRQPGAAYNGYYQEVVYHPLVASYSVAGKYDSMQEGHRLGNGFLHAILRQGQVHTAHGVKRFLQEVVRKAQRLGHVLDLRLDAGYTDGATLDYLTGEKLRFIGRLKSNAVLDRMAAPHLKRPVGRPPQGGYEDVIELGWYQAEWWQHPQRVLLVIVDRPDPKTGQLNLLPDYFFLVVGWQAEELDGPAALEHYRQRGTFEDRLGEFRQAIRPHLSHEDFQANEALLRLSLLAFNLASLLRIEYEGAAGSCFDLGRFQRDVLKAGGRVVKGANRLLLRVAQVVVLFWERLAACLALETSRPLPARFPPASRPLPARFPPPRGPAGRAPGCRHPVTLSRARCDVANAATYRPPLRSSATQTIGGKGAVRLRISA